MFYFERAGIERHRLIKAHLIVSEAGRTSLACAGISTSIPTPDAGHIAKASGVGMELELSDFAGWDIICRKVGEKSAIKAIVGGGEDYALIFTAPEGMGWLDSFATCIGRCTDGEGVEILLKGKKLEGLCPGYDHFA